MPDWISGGAKKIGNIADMQKSSKVMVVRKKLVLYRLFYWRCIRSCLETPVLSQSPQHNTNHSDVNPSFIGARETFVAFTEAA